MTRWIVSIIATLVLLFVLAAYGPGSLNAVKFEPSPPDPALAALFDTPTIEPEIREAGLIGAEDIVDYTPRENIAERLARRFGAGVGEGALRLLREAPAWR